MTLLHVPHAALDFVMMWRRRMAKAGLSVCLAICGIIMNVKDLMSRLQQHLFASRATIFELLVLMLVIYGLGIAFKGLVCTPYTARLLPYA